MESAATAQLRQELECFEKNRFELLARAAGEYVLIKGTEIAGTFASESEATGHGKRPFTTTGVCMIRCPIEGRKHRK
jgi:hypothetical protein